MGDSRSDRHNQVFKLAERFTKIFESSLLKESQAERDELETLRAQIEALGYSLAFVQINDTNGKCLKLKLAVMSNERTTTTH